MGALFAGFAVCVCSGTQKVGPLALLLHIMQLKKADTEACLLQCMCRAVKNPIGILVQANLVATSLLSVEYSVWRSGLGKVWL